MTNLLLSIKPHWAEKITSGEKIWELRKVEPREDTQSVIIYATSPISKIVGFADLNGVLICSPSIMWKKIQEENNPACISQQDFWEYYQGKKIAYGLVLIDPRQLNIPLTEIVELNPGFRPPQSYHYLSYNSSLMKKIKSEISPDRTL